MLEKACALQVFMHFEDGYAGLTRALPDIKELWVSDYSSGLQKSEGLDSSSVTGWLRTKSFRFRKPSALMAVLSDRITPA